MRVRTLELLWHGKQPILAADFDHSTAYVGGQRFATAGSDSCVRVWALGAADSETTGNDAANGVTYLATISKTTQPVNCVRWHPTDPILAFAGDDGCVVIAIQDNDPVPGTEIGNIASIGRTGAGDGLETWKVKSFLRGCTAEIYDLAWSPCGRFIVAACLDNTARVFSLAATRCVAVLVDHSNFVQGVAWDPLNAFFCSQSADRSVVLYDVKTAIATADAAMETSIASVSKAAAAAAVAAANVFVPVKCARLTDIRKRTRLATENSETKRDQNTIKPSESLLQSLPTSATSVPVGSSTTSTIVATNETPRKKAAKSARPAHTESIQKFLKLSSPAVNQSTEQKDQQQNSKSLTSDVNATITSEVGNSTDACMKEENNTLPTVVTTNTITSVNNENDNPEEAPVIKTKTADPNPIKVQKIFLDERLTSYFRRCTFSPEGSLMVLPCGLYQQKNAVYIYTRGCFAANNPYPIAVLSGFKKASVAVRFSPIVYKPILKEQDRLIRFPGYRMIFAVACQDAIFVFTTDSMEPIAVVGNLHYATLTDCCFSTDGHTLLLTSTDGFLSSITFTDAELGPVAERQLDEIKSNIQVRATTAAS